MKKRLELELELDVSWRIPRCWGKSTGRSTDQPIHPAGKNCCTGKYYSSREAEHPEERATMGMLDKISHRSRSRVTMAI